MSFLCDLNNNSRVTNKLEQITPYTFDNENDYVSMEIVCELLGHSSMKTTGDSYGKVVQKRISLEMARLKEVVRFY